MPNEYDFTDIVEQTPKGHFDFSDIVENPKKKASSKPISFGSETLPEAVSKNSKSAFSLAPTKSESSQGKTNNIQTPKIRELPVERRDVSDVKTFVPELEYQKPTNEYTSSIDEIIANAINRGNAQAEEANILTATAGAPSMREIQSIANTERRKQYYPTSAEYAEFNNAPDWSTALGALVRNPAKILTELTLESMTALARHGASRIGAGAAVGSVVPGVGTAGGSVIGMGLSSLNLEYSGKILESLQENGIDLKNAEQLKNAFEDEKIFDKVREDALKKGVPIALFDMLSAGVAGRIASKPAKTILRKVLQVGAEAGIQSGLSGAGELAGELASGEKISPSAILGEMVGEIAGGAPEVVTGTFIRKSKDGTATIKDAADVVLKNPNAVEDIDMAEHSGEIEPETADALKQGIETAHAINQTIPETVVDPEIRSQAISLIADRNDVDSQIAQKTQQLDATDEAFRPQIEQEIKDLETSKTEINKNIQLLNTKQDATQEINEQESIQREREEGNGSWEISEAGSSNSILSETPSTEEEISANPEAQITEGETLIPETNESEIRKRSEIQSGGESSREIGGEESSSSSVFSRSQSTRESRNDEASQRRQKEEINKILSYLDESEVESLRNNFTSATVEKSLRLLESKGILKIKC